MLRDLEHLKFIRKLPCVKCNSTPSQAAHIRRHSGGGMGIKSGDDRTLPQCHECHSLSHQIGEMRFYKDIWAAIDLAKGLYLLSGDLMSCMGLIRQKRSDLF